MDLDTYFKLRNTTREQFIEEEVKSVAKKRFERSLILDEIVRREEIEVDNAALDSEFNQTLNNLAMQGMDFGKVRGGKKGQQQLAQAVAMESANRVLTRRALDMLKSIAVGEYKTPSERKAEAEAKAAAEIVPEGETEQAVEADDVPAGESAIPAVLSESKAAGEAESSSEEETKS
jgi:FKBP-type peptidyl-prolyl cis-trans isomerase (trigger factor)